MSFMSRSIILHMKNIYHIIKFDINIKNISKRRISFCFLHFHLRLSKHYTTSHVLRDGRIMSLNDGIKETELQYIFKKYRKGLREHVFRSRGSRESCLATSQRSCCHPRFCPPAFLSILAVRVILCYRASGRGISVKRCAQNSKVLKVVDVGEF